MKIQHLPFLMLVLLLGSCMQGNLPGNNKPTDTLAFRYDTIALRESGCGSKPDSSCTHVRIKFPVFKGQSTLNDSIKTKLINLFWYHPAHPGDTALQKYVHYFIANYDKDKTTAQADIAGQPYTLDCDAKILRQDSSLTTIEISGYSYHGGVHDHDGTVFINWNTQTNKNVVLSDILKPGFKDGLNKIAENIFRKAENLGSKDPLTYYTFKDNRFELNNTFSVTPVGLRFFYNNYEIKPYADGPADLLIPYTQIKSLLLPHMVISQYLK